MQIRWLTGKVAPLPPGNKRNQDPSYSLLFLHALLHDKSTVSRVLDNMRVWPVLDEDPVRGVKALLEVDTLEARSRGLFDQAQPDGTAEVRGMLGLLIQRDRGKVEQ